MSAAPAERVVSKFDEEFDVVVVGYGYAGAISAIEAARTGAKVLVVEKATVPGGISICSYGAVRCAWNPDLAFEYLTRSGPFQVTAAYSVPTEPSAAPPSRSGRTDPRN